MATKVPTIKLQLFIYASTHIKTKKACRQMHHQVQYTLRKQWVCRVPKHTAKTQKHSKARIYHESFTC